MRLIDADELNKTLGIDSDSCSTCSWGYRGRCSRGCDFEDACCAIEDAPTIDAVPVVRCRDCVWYEIYQLKKDGTDDRRYKPSYCTLLRHNFNPDWYCADGEKRDVENS